ncbi:MAG: protein-export membrane protein SecF [Candidatus Sungbacteria bacterium RIFCSPLOWO2_02_FULL_48_13b]|uniref:Protein-export membrane protein SecF n=1 Tax=Candidatus Sungbacteria bacterium RIFCSPLOWO2_02_FULL_48_13b TaxID=1802283 RepID=A0A1G2LLC7_9BACT|nr:MAG: protein-export membrane protein SecF [Candidatus Sungbacteria bacterium RIFCSPLOWO2_02_FULL_48_13b]
MFLIHYRHITYIISGTLVLLSLIAVGIWGLKLGVDFTGGSLLEIEFASSRPETSEIGRVMDADGVAYTSIQPTGERGVLIRTESLSESAHQFLLASLRGKLSGGGITEKQFTSIGPIIGKELARKSVYAIGLVIFLIVLYIAWAFRKVSEPVASWKYGIATVIALVHDVAIPIGFFAVLGHFAGIEVDTLFVTALLTILGFSVHDTIVVFDRIRENLTRAKGRKDFEIIVGESISQTMTRSINTSMTVLLVLLAIFIFGGASIKYFSLALLIGIFFGTYSSICLASPVLVTWQKFREKNK